jgi:hypothetical protein
MSLKVRAKVLRKDCRPERGTVVVLEVTAVDDAGDAELLRWAQTDGINPFDIELPREPGRGSR